MSADNKQFDKQEIMRLAHKVIEQTYHIDNLPGIAHQLAEALLSATLPRDANSAWNAALDAAAKEVASHWNHSETQVNQQQQAQRSAAAILRMKRGDVTRYVGEKP